GAARERAWEGRAHEDAAGRLAQSRREIEPQGARAVAAQPVAERAPPGGKARHPDAAADEPRIRDAGGEHERAVVRRFVGEHSQHGEHVLGADPAMRNVAEMPRAARVAPRDLGPLVPDARASIGEEEVEQLVRVLAPAEPHERADDPDLVCRLMLANKLAVAAAP